MTYDVPFSFTPVLTANQNINECLIGPWIEI